jgi:hypothetical protein
VIVPTTSLDVGSSRMTALAASRSPHVAGFRRGLNGTFHLLRVRDRGGAFRERTRSIGHAIEVVQTPQPPVTSGLEVSQAEVAGQWIDVAAEHRQLLRRARPASQHEASRPRGHCHRLSERSGFGRRHGGGSTTERGACRTHSPEPTPYAGSEARGGTHPRTAKIESIRRCRRPRRHLTRLAAAIGHSSGRSGCAERAGTRHSGGSEPSGSFVPTCGLGSASGAGR